MSAADDGSTGADFQDFEAWLTALESMIALSRGAIATLRTEPLRHSA
jgi:hypothetical protein